MLESLRNNENVSKHDNIVIRTCLNKTYAGCCVCTVLYSNSCKMSQSLNVWILLIQYVLSILGKF